MYIIDFKNRTIANFSNKKLSIFSRMARANRGKTKLNDFSPYHVETSKVLLEQELRS